MVPERFELNPPAEHLLAHVVSANAQSQRLSRTGGAARQVMALLASPIAYATISAPVDSDQGDGSSRLASPQP